MGTWNLSPAITVAVPTIADAESDEVAVDVSAWKFGVAVGDAVLAMPQAALPTSAILLASHVTDTDEITVGFGTLEGGSGVTGANVSFKFLVWDES